jgi:hypothetical protein
LVEDPPPLYAFRIEILGIFPQIWRMFYCPSDTTLDGLHRIIAQVMGWHGRHGHCFVFSDEYSTLPHVLDFSEFKLGPMSLPSGGVTLESLKVPKSRLFIYVYDFGDKWVHGVRVLDLDYRPAEPGSRCGCVAGKRACPPDDCGGLGGYFRLLEIMADPGHPDHADAALWSWGYDPDLFEPMPVTL